MEDIEAILSECGCVSGRHRLAETLCGSGRFAPSTRPQGGHAKTALALIIVRRFVRKIDKQPRFGCSHDLVEKLITIGLRQEVVPIERRLYGSGAAANRHGVEPFEMKLL